MKERQTGKSRKNRLTRNDSRHFPFTFPFSFLYLAGVLTASLLTEVYLFPEILAPDCIRVVAEEEAGEKERCTEPETEGAARTSSEETMDSAQSAFRFYESPYRIVWKFFCWHDFVS